MNDDFYDNDYDLDMGVDIDEHPVTTLAAERLFGGEDGFLTYGREQRGSMTNITETLPEIDSRASEAISVEEVASPIDSTRPVLPQLFGLSGQNEQLQAQQLVH